MPHISSSVSFHLLRSSNDPRFSREGVAPSYFVLRRFLCERRAFVGCKLRRRLMATDRY
jgi:hypothetical protein